MENIIQFSISHEPEGYYVATGVEHPIVTEANTLDALHNNIQEATALYLEGEDSEELGLTSHPSL